MGTHSGTSSTLSLSRLGLGLGHGHAYAATGSVLGLGLVTALLVATGALVIVGVARLGRSNKKRAELDQV